jgi:hypothetical protein
MTSEQEPRVAWRPGKYARAIGMSRSWLYALPPELQPASVKLGANRLITEPPAQFLERLARYYGKAA